MLDRLNAALCAKGHDSRQRIPANAAVEGQNKKYFCAIGSTVAGSQLSSCPSARTW